MSNRLSVTVGGHTFYLKSDKDDEYLLNLAKTVDDRIEEKRQAAPSLTSSKAAVLVAMELMDEYNKLKEDYDTFNEEVRKLKF